MTETTETPETPATPQPTETAATQAPETESAAPAEFVIAVLGAPRAGTSVAIRGLIEAGTSGERFVPQGEPVDDFAEMMDQGTAPDPTEVVSTHVYASRARGRRRSWWQDLRSLLSPNTPDTPRQVVFADLPGALLFPPPATRRSVAEQQPAWDELRRANAVVVCVDAADPDSGALCRRHLGRLASMMFTDHAEAWVPRLVLAVTKADTWAAEVLDAREAAGVRHLPDGRLVEETSPHDLARRVCAQSRATALLGSDVIAKLAEAVEPHGEFAITAVSSTGFCPYSGRPVWTGAPVKLAAETLVDRRAFGMRATADFLWDGTRRAPLQIWNPNTSTALGPVTTHTSTHL